MTSDLLASTYEDPFARNALPPPELWPKFDVASLRELYPTRVNAAAEILDRAVERGYGGRLALKGPELAWTYEELIDKSNRVANRSSMISG